MRGGKSEPKQTKNRSAKLKAKKNHNRNQTNKSRFYGDGGDRVKNTTQPQTCLNCQ